MANEDEILAAWRRREHAREKRELWRSTVTAAIVNGGYESSSRFADEVVEEYDKRFNPDLKG
jgi:hypothetical protein